MPALLSLLPILILIVLLTVAKWSAMSAGGASAIVAAVIAILAMGYGGSGLGLAASLLGPLLEALFQAAGILWIIFPALWIYEYQSRTDGVATLGRWFANISDDRRVAAIMIAWFFGLFLEGAAGFGTPVALAAPLLVALGYSPMKALILALLGHAVGVSFGAVGTPIGPLLAVDPGLDPRSLSMAIILLHAMLGGAMVALVWRLADAGGERGRPIFWVATTWLCFFVPAVLLAWSVGPELPTLGGALIGAVAFSAIARRQRATPTTESADGGPKVIQAALPYLVVVAVILASRIVPGAADALRDPVLRWSAFGSFGGEIAPFYHPGSMLLVSVGLLALVSRGRSGSLRPSAGAAAARLPKVAAALVAVLLLSRLMVHSGMIGELADAAATALGKGWPLAAPAVGALGSFLTGSATASNILFAPLQHAAAVGAAIPVLPVVAAQGVGAAIGNIIAPHNIVAGAAIVGLAGREGEVLRRTLPICLIYSAGAGALIFAVALFL